MEVRARDAKRNGSIFPPCGRRRLGSRAHDSPQTLVRGPNDEKTPWKRSPSSRVSLVNRANSMPMLPIHPRFPTSKGALTRIEMEKDYQDEPQGSRWQGRLSFQRHERNGFSNKRASFAPANSNLPSSVSFGNLALLRRRTSPNRLQTVLNESWENAVLRRKSGREHCSISSLVKRTSEMKKKEQERIRAKRLTKGRNVEPAQDLLTSRLRRKEWRAYERNNYADEIFKFEHGPLTRERQRRMKVGEERQQQQGRPNSISPIQKMLRDYLKEFEIDEDDISGRRIQKFTFDK
eukprot:jgi/Bigna1/90081/estExt_fgenesh1_pg.C_610123